MVGITSLFISAKYEEIYPPHIKEFSDVTDKTYTKAEILDMEGKILLTLNFNITVPSPLRFLDRYAKIMKFDSKILFFIFIPNNFYS